ncbi:unnamed protein product [Didymodactylos carnosus]|uniref:SHSP domain-containing protein n=1 Tax=Didymodactylos carnosus TaxID=1234261 RepID=A0A814IQ32_9BILA|nr:unnamed protein product [Didymodactylos carnosus]CAF1105039.1 unnamed protein product [Didymodactylos carnosus]CAF3798244.1 unnamed protein product [Didymodactylos carnosus]CAF3867942.1 unnamed protein product [Didymodactylos carnosus]
MNDSHNRTVIPVTVNSSDDQRFIPFRSSGAESDISSRMSVRMKEFEEECQRWREKFFNESRIEPGGIPSSSLPLTRPRMRVDFPDFPEFSTDWPAWRGSTLTSGSNNNQRSFIEEDYDGRKKYKIQFDIGEFRPEELNVKVEGRLLIVKGDRQVKVGNATESKQFNRELTLPEFVDIQTLQSYLSPDGKLTLEAPVIMDRVYGSNASQLEHRQVNPGRIVDTTFIGGRQPTSSFGTGALGVGGNTQSSYSSTSSSSYRQDGGKDFGNSSFHRNSPLRDHIASTSSTSSTLGGGSSLLNSQGPTTYSTITSRPDYTISDRGDGTRVINYTFNLSEFAQEDIAIHVNDTMLKVTASRNEQDGHSSSLREFKREIGLPDGAEAKKITSTLSSEGTLNIQIPVQDYRPLPTPIPSQQYNLGGGIDTYSLDDQQLKFTFDLSGYRPEDVNVKVNENLLKVQAIHIDNSRGNQINREYSRQYALPNWVDIDSLRAKMSEDSILTVEVPIPHDRIGLRGSKLR